MAGIDTTRVSVLERARSGDASEFARLYGPLSYSIARKLGLAVEDAEDVMQQALIDLLRALSTLQYDRNRGTFKGLVKKVVHDRACDLRRRRTHEKPAEALEALPDPIDRFDMLFEHEWLKTHWGLALDCVRTEVKPTTFQSFQLVVLEERPIGEAAGILGLTANQVAQNKRRVMQRLRAHFEELRDGVT